MKKAYVFASLFFVIIFSFLVFQKINLTTADIGRHVTNGRLFVHAQSLGISRTALLHTNFFSYTHPDFPFINHHWGSGILSYLVFLVAGFSGLSFVYGSCLILAFLALFLLWKDLVPVMVTFPIALFLVPLVAERTEVRPEGLSYLFIAVMVAVLYMYTKDMVSRTWLVAVLVISLIWVNTHIYFIFAPFFIGAFLAERLLVHIVNRKNSIVDLSANLKKIKDLTALLVLTVFTVCINPYGIHAVIYPFIIFKNYGYMIAENQSISFLTHFGMRNPNFLWWYVATSILVLSSLWVFWKQRAVSPVALPLISVTFAVLSFLGIRHLTAYGLVLLPTFCLYASLLYTSPSDSDRHYTHSAWSTICSIILCALIIFQFNARMPWNADFGLGLKSGVMQSADFVKSQHISGPFFSNYDIGGYIIFSLYPEKIFVDNRPEAYPAAFFTDLYEPMQTDTTVWNTEADRYHFNAIWFYRNDLTPWAQTFLLARVRDPQWAPVFVDEYTIIFLRRVNQNQDIIRRFELPQSMFGVR